MKDYDYIIEQNAIIDSIKSDKGFCEKLKIARRIMNENYGVEVIPIRADDEEIDNLKYSLKHARGIVESFNSPESQ